MKSLPHMLRDIDNEIKLTCTSTGKAVLDERVKEAISRVPRHEFVPKEAMALAYNNGPLAIGWGQTISQPFIVALMTDLLNTRPDHTVLEIGTGSCYQAAVLAQLVHRVYSVEIIEGLAQQAGDRLQRLGYTNVRLRTGDGYYGWSEHAPYDAIIATAAVSRVPPALVKQLKPGARLVIPVGQACFYQQLTVVEKKDGGAIDTKEVLGVAFVPLTGVHHSEFV